MEKRRLFILLGLLAAAGAFADAYTWTDENGIVHYSDKPSPNATVIELSTSTAPRPRPAVRPAPQQASVEAPAPQLSYQSIEISKPAAEETLWNIGGTLSVSISISPALRPGHQIRVYYDDTAQIVAGRNFRLQEVYRGTHNLQAEVIDETGTLMIRSNPSRFYVHQSTVNN